MPVGPTGCNCRWRDSQLAPCSVVTVKQPGAAEGGPTRFGDVSASSTSSGLTSTRRFCLSSAQMCSRGGGKIA